MNSKQRRIVQRAKQRRFPKGSKVYIGKDPAIYTVDHHCFMLGESSPMVHVSRVAVGGVRLDYVVNYARLKPVSTTTLAWLDELDVFIAVMSEQEKPAELQDGL